MFTKSVSGGILYHTEFGNLPISYAFPDIGYYSSRDGSLHSRYKENKDVGSIGFWANNRAGSLKRARGANLLPGHIGIFPDAVPAQRYFVQIWNCLPDWFENQRIAYKRTDLRGAKYYARNRY